MLRPFHYPAKGSEGQPPNAYWATIHAFRVVFQVLDYFGGEVMEITDSWHKNFMHRIWPPTGQSVTWPANSVAINDHELDLLAIRDIP